MGGDGKGAGKVSIRLQPTSSWPILHKAAATDSWLYVGLKELGNIGHNKYVWCLLSAISCRL